MDASLPIMGFLFRLCFSILRSALVALSMMVTGWLMVVSPTPEERSVLSGGGADMRTAVTQMRLARAALRYAPDLAIAMIHKQGGGAVSRAEVESGLRAIAAGRPAQRDAPPPARHTGGAKFVKPPSEG